MRRLLLPAALLLAAPRALGVQLLTDGDFESVETWTESSSGGYAIVGDWSDATGGNMTTNSAFFGGYPNADDELAQTFLSPGAASATLSFDLLRYTADTTGYDLLTVELDGQAVDRIDLGDAFTVGFDGPSRVSLDVTPYVGLGLHELRFVGTTDAAVDSFATVDNASLDVQAVPEPATFAVLGIGALAFLRRRR